MNNVPSIRFNSFTDEWKFKLLKHVVNSISTGKLDANAAKIHGKYKFFTCAKEDYLTDTYSFEGDAVIINGNGELGITKSFSGKFDAYQRTYVLMDFNDDYKYLSYAIPVYLPERIRTEAIGGAMPYIKIDTLNDLKLMVPSLDEQKQIAIFLDELNLLLDSKIEEQTKIKNIKDTMLVKMFPKVQENVPELRFDGFVDPWNSVIFGDAFDKLSNNSFSRDLLNYKKGSFKNIHYGDILTKYGFTINSSSKIVPYVNSDVIISQKEDDFLRTGDVVFADTAEDTTAGKMVEIINVGGTYLLAGLHTFACRPKIEFELGYLGIYLNSDNFHDQLIPYMQGTKVTGFNYDFLSRTIVKFPSLAEQRKIVSFFNNLQEIIENLEKEILFISNLIDSLRNRMFAEEE